MVHLVYCDDKGKKGEKALDKILAGTKTMVVRGAAGKKVPHSRVFEGETLYFMEKGTARVSAMATVKSAQNYVKLADEEINARLEKNQPKLLLTDKQIERWHKKCLCFVEFDNVCAVEPPLVFTLQGNMDDWLIMENISEVTRPAEETEL